MTERIDNLSDDQALLEQHLVDVGEKVDHLVEAIEARPTKRTIAWVMGLLVAALLVAGTVNALAVLSAYNLSQRNAEVLEILDPESPEYQERVEQNRAAIVRANRISNCVLETSILEQFNTGSDPDDPDYLQPSDACKVIIERYPDEYAEALEGN